MSLLDVKHQGHAQSLLQRAIRGERVPHAYIFHGPDGVGKETLAQGFAQLLLCCAPTAREEGGEAADVGVAGRLRVGCGRCEDCRAVAQHIHPDLHVIYRQLNRAHPEASVRKRTGLELSVDVLRHFVIDKVRLTPVRGRAKVFIIRQADRMTVQAQNALLKTLEEPPDATFLILPVSAMDRLLPTTRSRCQLVRFDTLPTGFVRRRLGELAHGLEPGQLDFYARVSDGSLGLAAQHAKDGLYEVNQRLADGLARLPGARGDRLAKVWTDESKALGDRYGKRDPGITQTEATRRGLQAVLRLAATWYADVLRAGAGRGSGIVNTAWGNALAQASQRIGAARAADAVGRIAEAERQLDLNVNTQLCIETLLNDLARLGASGAVRS